VANAVKVPVIGNGDVVDKKTFDAAMQRGVSAVMIGRGALGTPWVFGEITGSDLPVNKFDIAREHLSRLMEHFPAILVVGNMKKHLARYVKGMRGVNQYKDRIYSARTTKELFDVIDDAERENRR
jgi:tRNA-dihydrouridine synthase